MASGKRGEFEDSVNALNTLCDDQINLSPRMQAGSKKKKKGRKKQSRI